MSSHGDATARQRVYRGLQRRNRIVSVLRLAVPTLGVLTLVALVGQIYLANLANRFRVGNIAVTPDTITVDTPEYIGMLEDGSAYHVWATEAKAATANTDLIDLTDASMTLDRISGVRMLVNASTARLDTATQIVTVDGTAYVEDSTGTSGVLEQSTFDWHRQFLDATGPVHIDYMDGTTIDAVGMTYDADKLVWTFSNAKVILPATPGAKTP